MNEEEQRRRAARSPSQVCREDSVQNCHACEAANCGDNTTPAVVELRRSAERWRQRALSPHLDGDGTPMLWSRLFADADASLQVAERDAAAFHRVMQLLRDMLKPHGTCKPRERKACTACNAMDELARILSDYKGAPLKLSEQGPTAWAYEQACKALRKHSDDAQAMAHVITRFGVSHEDLDACGCEECERVRRGMLGGGFLQPRNDDEARYAGP